MCRRATLTLLAALLVAAALPSAASALTITGGWQFDWPYTAHERLAPGAALTVSVAPLKGDRRSARGKLRLVLEARFGDGGRKLLARRFVRRGSVRLRIPRGAGGRYALRAYDGRRMVMRTLITAVTPDPPPPSAGAGCSAERAPAAALELDRAVARAGDVLTVAVVNSGPCTVGAGYPYRWERLVDGAWQPVVTGEVFILPLKAVPPGGRWTSPARVAEPSVMPPGRYRVVKSVGGFGGDGGQLTLTAELDVVG
jgi:hypothetical protein